MRASARRLSRELAAAGAAVLLAHLLFAVLTRMLAGQWPDWGWYLGYLGTMEGFGALPVRPWSGGLLIGGIYIASLAGVAVLRAQAPRVFSEERIALMGVAGAGVLGFASLSYFVGRSHPSAVALLALPGFVAVALWLGILERRRDRVPVTARAGALFAVFAAAGMLAVFSWPTIEQRAPDTPLAMGLFGAHDGSFGDQLGRMWRSEPLTDRAEGGLRLVRRHFPGHGPVPVMAQADLTTEILVQSGRVNSLPVSHFLEDGLLLERSWPRVMRAIDAFPPGTLMLTQRDVLEPVPRAPTGLDILTHDAETLLR